MKLLKNVLIKLTKGGFTDKVIYIDNLPEEILYDMAYPRKYVGKGIDNHTEPDMEKEKVPTLKEGLSVSQTGDNGIMFDLNREPGQALWAQVHRYIKRMTPPNQQITHPAINAEDPSDTKSRPLPLDKIPRAVLPVLSPPTAGNGNPDQVEPVVGTVAAAPSISDEEKDKIIAEYEAKKKAEARNRMAKAREARKK